MKLCSFLLSLLLLLSSALTSHAQTSEISRLLQHQLHLEIEGRIQFSFEIDSLGNEVYTYDEDKNGLIVTEPFVIHTDTLYYTIKTNTSSETVKHFDQQKVALKDIKIISKDIGVFLETDPGKVISTRTTRSDEVVVAVDVRTTDLFETHIGTMMDLSYFADLMIAAFQTAGYRLEKGSWYD